MIKSFLIAGLLVLVAPAAWAQNTIVPGRWTEDLGWGTGPQDYNAANASGVPGHWINGPSSRSRALLGEGYASMAYPSCNPNAVAITDEYGFKYNCRGARLR